MLEVPVSHVPAREKPPTTQTSLLAFNQIPVSEPDSPMNENTSMERLKAASSSLLPPFKSVGAAGCKLRVQSGSEDFSGKIYTESQTIVLTRD